MWARAYLAGDLDHGVSKLVARTGRRRGAVAGLLGDARPGRGRAVLCAASAAALLHAALAAAVLHAARPAAPAAQPSRLLHQRQPDQCHRQQ
jgi:hypothetical protein